MTVNLSEELSGEFLYKLKRRTGKTRAEICEMVGLTMGQVGGRIFRYEQSLKPHAEPEKPKLFDFRLPQPLYLEGDWIIVGDVQAPTTDYDFSQLPAAIAQLHLPGCRGLILVGDVLNVDCFTSYPKLVRLPSWRDEVDAATHLFKQWLEVFPKIHWLMGNHEHRIFKFTNADMGVKDLKSMVLDNSRIEMSMVDRAYIDTPRGRWCVAHGDEFSVNQLIKADLVAQKERCHVILHHEHHLAHGWDRYGYNVIVNNGGLFDQQKMAFVQLKTNTKPRMKKGFTMLRDGHAYVFGEEPYTNWSDWLEDKPTNEAERPALALAA